MKASDLILQLGQLLVQHGDLEVKLPDAATTFGDQYMASQYLPEHDPVEGVSISGWKDDALNTQFFLLE